MGFTDHDDDNGRIPPKKLRISDILPCYSEGLTLGTLVFTADGEIPVEYLEPGDRIVTRAGMRTLRGIDTPAPKRFKLKFDRAEVVYAGGVQVMSDTGTPFAA